MYSGPSAWGIGVCEPTIYSVELTGSQVALYLKVNKRIDDHRFWDMKDLYHYLKYPWSGLPLFSLLEKESKQPYRIHHCY